MATKFTGKPPQVSGHWRDGCLGELSRGALEFHARSQNDFGDVVAFKLGQKRCYQVTHPDDLQRIFRASNSVFKKGYGWAAARSLLGDGLITTEPRHWLARRRALQPAFLRCYHEQFAQTFAHTIQHAMPRFEQLAQAGEPAEIVDEMSRLTLNNAFQTLMEHDISDDMDGWMQHVCMVTVYANSFFSFPAYKRFLVRYFPHTWHGRYHKSSNELKKLLDLIVKARLEKRGNGEEERTDLLSQLLFHPDRSPRRNFSPRYVRDEAMSFLFAAHETTAVTLSWAWFFLSQNPHAEAQLHEELDRVLDGRPPALSDLEKMPYGRMVIDETLRLRPPVWNIARQTTQTEVVGGYEIPRNAIVLMIVWLAHRHPDFWDEPERFDPERFSPEASAGRHPFAYVPFGGGPRQCIGRRTALIETQLALSMIAQRFTLRLAPGYVAKPLPNITLRPSDNLPMILHRRPSR